jgi:hypothetical protein
VFGPITTVAIYGHDCYLIPPETGDPICFDCLCKGNKEEQLSSHLFIKGGMSKCRGAQTKIFIKETLKD